MTKEIWRLEQEVREAIHRGGNLIAQNEVRRAFDAYLEAVKPRLNVTDPREHPAFEQRSEEDALDHEVVNEVSRQLREAFGSEQADLGQTICRLLVGGLQHGDLTRERAREFGERLAFVLRQPFRSRAKPLPRFGREIVDMTYSLRPDSDTPPTIDVVKPRAQKEEPPRLAGAAVEGLAILSGNSPENAAQLRDQHNAGADMRPWVMPKREREADASASTLAGATGTMGAVEAVRTKQRIAERTRRLAAAMLERWRDNTPGEQTVDQLESRTYDALVALVHSIACELEP